jgi:hypothetical protein
MTETFGFDGALDGGSDASGYTWAASNDIGVLLWAWATWDNNNGNGSGPSYTTLAIARIFDIECGCAKIGAEGEVLSRAGPNHSEESDASSPAEPLRQALENGD